MFNLNEWLQANYSERTFGKYRFSVPRPPLVCADGYALSVQAGRAMFSAPRIDNAIYESVEVGYPNAPTPELDPYGDDGVYSYVPVAVVEAIVTAHGGVMLQEAQHHD